MKKIIAFICILALSGFVIADNIMSGGNTIAVDTHALTTVSASALIGPSFIVTSSTYGSNQVVGGLLSLTGAVRSAGGSANLKSVIVIDNNNPVQKLPLQFVIFDSTNLSGTYTDHTSVNINSLDIPHILWTGTIPATSYIQTSGTLVAISQTALTQSPVVAASGTSTLGAIIITTATSAQALSGTTTLSVKFGFDQN
jgi:hypothetical protein